MRRKQPVLAVAALVLGALGVAANRATALDFAVTKTADTRDGSCNADCSLREAISAANAQPGGPHRVLLPAGHFVLSIAGANESQNQTGDLDVRTSMTIEGAGMDGSVVDANGIDRVLELPLSGTIEIRDLSLRGGRLGDTNGCGLRNSATADLTLTRVRVVDNGCTGESAALDTGGGIYVDANASLSIVESVVESNYAQRGGGIAAITELSIFASTLAWNEAAVSGGALYGYGDWTIADTTIHDNAAGGVTHGAIGTARFYSSTISRNDGWAIRTDGDTTLDNVTIAENHAFEAVDIDGSGSLVLRNSIVANDLIPDGVECSTGANVASLGYNLDGDGSCANAGSTDLPGTDPQLLPLRHYGGPTRTHYPGPGSPVLDRGAPAGCLDGGGLPSAEQRGFARIVDADGIGGARCDIGAVEYAPEPGALGLGAAAFLSLAAAGGRRDRAGAPPARYSTVTLFARLRG